MSANQLVDYSNVKLATITFNDYGWPAYAEMGIKNSSIRNKIAVIYNDEYGDALTTVRGRCKSAYWVSPSNSLYVAPECRISRDFYRNSGYTITRDPDKADYTVIPQVFAKSETYLYNVIGKDVNDNTLYICSVRTNGSDDHYVPWGELDFPRIQEMFVRQGRNMVFFSPGVLDDSNWRKPHVNLIPDIPVYKEILLGQYPTRKYTEELTPPLPNATPITPETLEIWRRMGSSEMTQKLITGSDWIKYPFTVFTFLDAEMPQIFTGGNKMFRLMLDQIGYRPYYYSVSSLMHGRTISQEDFNMLQDYLMFRLGVSRNGGYIAKENFKNMDKYMELFKHAVVVAPVRITEPVLYDNIKTLADRK